MTCSKCGSSHCELWSKREPKMGNAIHTVELCEDCGFCLETIAVPPSSNYKPKKDDFLTPEYCEEPNP